MNNFGRLAQDRWKQLAPAAYAKISDPNRHFSTLGEQAEAAWIELSDEFAGPDVPGETYLEKIGRLNNARKRAEEVIQADWLTPLPQDQESETEQLDQAAARMMAIELDGDREELAKLGITLELLGWTQAQLEELQEG